MIVTLHWLCNKVVPHKWGGGVVQGGGSSPPLPPTPRFCGVITPFLMNIQRSNPINISRYGRSRHKSHDFEELSCLRTTESHQSFSPNLGSPSPPETPDSSHCISRIGDYLLLEPLEGDHVFRAAHLHSGEELVCKVSRHMVDVSYLCGSQNSILKNPYLPLLVCF